MKKTLTAILLFIMTIVMAVAATGCFGGDSSSSETPDPGQSTGGDSSGGQEEKADAAAVADLKVNTKAVATFTAADGFEYRFVIDGEDVSVEGLNGKYDVSEYVSSSGKTHTIAVYSKENEKYKKSALSNEVKVKALDTENVNFAITADKKVTFNAVEGYEYYLSVNGTETKVTENQDVSALIAGGENTSMMVKLVIKGNASGDIVTLDATAKEILNIVWHKKITDFAYNNGVIAFSSELNYIYDLYAEGELIKADVRSGEDVSAIISGTTEKQLTLYVKVNGNAANNAFVSAENEKSNEVVLKFLSAPEVSATVSGEVITLTITDENAEAENSTYELFIDGESAGVVENGQDISTLFAKKGEARISAKVSASGYISSEIGEEASVIVPDYNRFHFVADNADNAEIGGLYGEKTTIKAYEEGVKVSSDITVDLTKANKKSAIIAINNPSDHPAGVEKITINILSSDGSKFIRIVATAGDNGYNAHIYGGFGENLDGSLREKLEDGNYALVDANYGEIVDYNILWVTLGLGKAEGDQGANDGWYYSQKRQLTLVYDNGKIGYYSPACKFVPFMDLSTVAEFSAEDFANAKLSFTFDKLISTEKAGYAKATHTLEVYGNGVDYTEEFMIDKEGFSITSADVLKNSNGYVGIYLNVQPVGQDDIPAADWDVMEGSYKGAVTLNGVAYADMILKITAQNKLFLATETSELNAIIANATYFNAPLYIEIPAGSTFTYNGKEWKTHEKIGICSYYENDEIKWQSCTHDSHEYNDDVAVTLNGEVKRTQWTAFDVELKDVAGNHINLSTDGVEHGITVNGEVLLNGEVMDPWFVTSDWNGYLLIKTSDGKVFENEAAFNAAKAAGTVYTITIKAGTKFIYDGKNYVLTEDMTYKLSLINGEYVWRGESPSQKDNIVAAKISAEQTDGYNYVKFEFAEKSNGFESENWDVFITVADGAKFNDDALALKRAGKGSNPFFYIDNTTGRTAVTGDTITFKAGDYYNATTKLGITLDKDYVLTWNGTAWVLDDK